MDRLSKQQTQWSTSGATDKHDLKICLATLIFVSVEIREIKIFPRYMLYIITEISRNSKLCLWSSTEFRSLQETLVAKGHASDASLHIQPELQASGSISLEVGCQVSYLRLAQNFSSWILYAINLNNFYSLYRCHWMKWTSGFTISRWNLKNGNWNMYFDESVLFQALKYDFVV